MCFLIVCMYILILFFNFSSCNFSTKIKRMGGEKIKNIKRSLSKEIRSIMILKLDIEKLSLCEEECLPP